MEKLPVQKKYKPTPAKLLLAGVFLGLVIVGGWKLSANALLGASDSLGREEIVLQSSGSGVGSGDIAGTSTLASEDRGTEREEREDRGSSPNLSALPARLRIPKLGINSRIQHLGLTATGNMDTPKSDVDVGWYKLGAKPGELGSAVIAGHVNTYYNPHGVFERLGDLSAGDIVEVVNGDGTVLRFRVTGKSLLDYNASAADVFGSTGSRRLNLITCTGKWLPEKKTYSDRLVVFTELI